MKAINIKWNIDNEEYDEEYGVSLPNEIEIPEWLIDELDEDDDLDEIISDYLSDVIGFCHYGFELIG